MKAASAAALKNNPKVTRAWTFYDWANSVYSLSVATVLFPAYYAGVTEEKVDFLGVSFLSEALYAYTISASYLVVALLAPLLSGMADYTGAKRSFMAFFAFLGSLSCAMLFLFDSGNVGWGITCAFMASIGFAGSLVFYNAFLPEIATPDRFDSLSAKGFSMGYIGSVILLIINLVNIEMYETFGFADKGAATRFSFIVVALWWALFSIYSLRGLPKGQKAQGSSSLLAAGFVELGKAWRLVQATDPIKRFITSFFLYSMGVQTVIYMASIYAANTLGFEMGELIIVILIIQLVAIPGAFGLAAISKRTGNIQAIILAIFIWALICLLAYLVTPGNRWLFYVIAFMVGAVMGGIQSLSRATYAKLFPTGWKDTASLFSFYELTEKLAIVVGTMSFGVVQELSGGMRNSVFVLMLYFLASLPFLWSLKGMMRKDAEKASS